MSDFVSGFFSCEPADQSNVWGLDVASDLGRVGYAFYGYVEGCVS